VKITVYGYIDQIQSSRRLERETARNVEMMGLTGRLTPDFKTIADFRKDNGPAIRSACRQFVALMSWSEPFHPRDRGDRRQPVQGGQFPRQVVLARARSSAAWSRSRRASGAICRRLKTADREARRVGQAKSARLKDKIASLREQMRKVKALRLKR